MVATSSSVIELPWTIASSRVVVISALIIVVRLIALLRRRRWGMILWRRVLVRHWWVRNRSRIPIRDRRWRHDRRSRIVRVLRRVGVGRRVRVTVGMLSTHLIIIIIINAQRTYSGETTASAQVHIWRLVLAAPNHLLTGVINIIRKLAERG